MRVALIIIGVVVAVGGVSGALILLITRRSHLRSWRMGLFYESEERFADNDPEEEDL